jgi:hypothetical protein
MKNTALTNPCFLLSVALLAVPSFAQQTARIWTGVPVNLTTLTLHVSGQPISVYELTVSIYPMNTAPPWPVGLWLYTYLQADSGNPLNKKTWGQSSWCQWWFSEVATLELQNPKHLPYPFFEMNMLTSASPLQTDEGIPVYPAGSVTCWQANNDYAP